MFKPHNEVLEPELNTSNRYHHSGLSFTFVSEAVHELDTVVRAHELTFKVVRVALNPRAMGHNQAFLYQCVGYGNYGGNIHTKTLSDICGCPLEVVTDADELKGIRRSASYC